MDKVLFVQNIKLLCKQKGIKPTVACRESGVGQSFINNIESRGQVPSVEKVQILAQYLGVTVSELIGEVPPASDTVTLRDSAAQSRASDMLRLSIAEVDMVLAYRQATPKERKLVDLTLAEYVPNSKKGTTAGAG